MPVLSEPETDLSPIDRRLIDLRHAGTSWPDCAKQLRFYTVAALRMRANRLRDAKRWKLANGKPADGAPTRGKRGRPKNAVPNVPVSLRFTVDVVGAVRTVAACAGVREGLVVAEAMQRAVSRAAGKRVPSTPLGLSPGKSFELCDGHKTETISVNVPKPVYDALVGKAAQPNTVIAEAVHRLLRDLNYRLVECE